MARRPPDSAASFYQSGFLLHAGSLAAWRQAPGSGAASGSMLATSRLRTASINSTAPNATRIAAAVDAT